MALNATCNERLENKGKLLRNLIRTVDILVDVSIFKQSLFFLWSGLTHLHTRVKAVLRHGAKVKHHLIYAQPSFAAFDSWLEAKLLDHSLAEELWENRKEIQHFYHEWAFIHDSKLFISFISALRVLATRDFDAFDVIIPDEKFSEEQSTMDLVTGIEVLANVLPIGDSSGPENLRENTICPVTHGSSETDIVDDSGISFRISSLSQNSELPCSTSAEEMNPSYLSIPTFSYSSTSPATSPPEFSILRQEIEDRSDSDTGLDDSSRRTSDIDISRELRSTERSLSVNTVKMVSGRSRSNSSQEKYYTEASFKKGPQSFLESGGFVQPPALGNFPLPQKGQSLTSFLSSFPETLPELDRENAHFHVAEALISAFERLKASRSLDRLNQMQSFHETTTEDLFGTVRVLKRDSIDHGDVTSTHNDVGMSTRTTFYGGKSFPRPQVVHTETEESEIEYWKQRQRRPPPFVKKPRAGKQGSDGRSGESAVSTTGVSTSVSSSPSSTEDYFTSTSYSAENVAFNLLRQAKMKEENLPLASELKWMVSENEAPQSLLPMPKNWTSASESESDYSSKTEFTERLDKSLRLRGTSDWAPPRPQIIFTVHPSPNLNILTETQRYRCAGCGMKVDAKYISTFRYCFYLGRYFCTGCHTGKKARLPQMILHKWDFSPYMVSNFSATLLESLQSDPVYNAFTINPNLTRRVKLNNFRNYRIQLAALHHYLENCKCAERLYEELIKFPKYYTSDVDLFSLQDLINVRFSTGLPMMLKEFVSMAVYHVLHCKLCRNLGFICELCKRDEIIFPFQISRVSRCPKCATCYHLKCFNPNSSDCPKCLRVTKRRNTVDAVPASIAV